MINADVVAYLQTHIKDFPVEDLRRQLFDEGIAEEDFNDSLKAALGSPIKVKLTPRQRLKNAVPRLAAALAACAVILWFSGQEQNSKRGGAPTAGAPASASGAFVGHSGYVVRLPKNYTAVSQFVDAAKTDEMVHFCKVGTDPTLFLNEGLFGSLGIIALEVTPSPFPPTAAGIAALTAAVTTRAQNHGFKFSAKNISVSSLPGVQLNIELPDPHIEVYILGERSLYSFTAGQEDEISREIVMSLRDTQSEN